MAEFLEDFRSTHSKLSWNCNYKFCSILIRANSWDIP